MYLPDPNSTAPVQEYIFYGPQKNDHTIYSGDPNGAPARWAGNVLLDPNTGDYTGPGVSANWSPTLEDNPSAKIDFEGLIGATDSAVSLYDNLYSLIGTQLGFPCGSCRAHIEGVRFGASEFEMTVNQFQSGDSMLYESFSEINLSNVSFEYKGTRYDEGYFQAVKQMQQSHANSTKTAQEKAAEAKDLASAIAKSLADHVFQSLEADMRYHFDRVDRFKTKNADGTETESEYALIVYDFRDKEKLDKAYDANASMINTGSTLDCTINYYKTLKEETAREVITQKPIQIMASGEVYDSIPIHLPDISLETLNLTDYDITKYSYKEFYEKVPDDEMAAYEAALKVYKEACEKTEEQCKKIDEEYQEKLSEYNQERRIWEENNTTKTTTYREVTTTQTTMKSPPKWGYNKNGERVQTDPPVYETITTTSQVPVVHVTVTGTDPEPKRPQKPPYPASPKEPVRPQPKKHIERYYNPSDVAVLDDALATVTAARADFGARQNRLEHAYAYAYDCNAEENLQASESRMRDTDMGQEMVNFARQNMLEQFEQSVLAQANHAQDGVLALLE